MKPVSVIIPIYNEEEALPSVLKDLQETFRKNSISHEIIVVDDCSTDRSREVISQNDVRIISHTRHLGPGAARKTGLLQAKGEYIVMIDGDGTYPVDVIPSMIQKLEMYDMVIGARKRETGSLKIIRLTMKFIIRILASYLVDYHIPDLNSGLRTFKKEIALQFMYMLPDTHSWVSTITLAFITNNYSINFIDIDYHKRIGKSKFRIVKDTYNYMLTIIRTILLFNPLKFFIPVSILLFILFLTSSLRSILMDHTLQQIDIILFLAFMLVGILGLMSDLLVTLFKKINS